MSLELGRTAFELIIKFSILVVGYLFTVSLRPKVQKVGEPSISDQYIQVTTFQDYIARTITTILGAVIQQLIVAAAVEYVNPIPKTKLRLSSLYAQLKQGCKMISIGAIAAISWLQFIEPHTKYHRYYDTHEYGLREFLIGFVVHQVYFTILSFFVHKALHIPFLYKTVHQVHHSFREPSAFGYAAAHPIEGLCEGSFLHHTIELLYPMHPVAQMVYGLWLQFNDMFAHDGGQIDMDDHQRHHLYFECNYGDRNLDWIFGSQFSQKKFPYLVKSMYVDRENLTYVGTKTKINEKHPMIKKYLKFD